MKAKNNIVNDSPLTERTDLVGKESPAVALRHNDDNTTKKETSMNCCDVETQNPMSADMAKAILQKLHELEIQLMDRFSSSPTAWPEYMNQKTAARYTGLDVKTFKEHIGCKILSYQAGQQVLYKRELIDELMLSSDDGFQF